MDRPTGSSHISLTMGGLCAIGGLAGYLKTGSTPSLLAGVGIGGLYCYGGYLINVRVLSTIKIYSKLILYHLLHLFLLHYHLQH